MITWIIPNISIGELSDLVFQDEDVLENIKKLKEYGMTTVLDIREVSDPREAKGFREAWHKGILIRYVWTPVPSETGKNKFLEGLSLAYCKLSSIFFADPQEKVLVHCTAGMDRSPFIVAKYLVEKIQSGWEDSDGHWMGCNGKEPTYYHFKTMSDAYAFIKKKRPWICEHLEWIWWKE